MNAAERNTNSEPSSTEVLEYIKNSDLHDLGYSGNMFTWTSNSHGTGKIKSRLDRSLVNSEWMLSYPNDALFHLLLKLSIMLPSFYPCSAAFLLTEKLSNTRCILSRWSKETFGNIHAKITLLQEDLQQLQASDIQGSNTEKVKKLEIEIYNLNEIQASSNMQKSRDHFYNVMDRNSKYFHIRVNRRRARNKIDSLLAPDGSWCLDRASIENHIPSCITEQDNEKLTKIPDDVEIYDALMSMQPWTSPGPDRFPPGFYQTQ
ncbi:uncharacterized protein LOC113340529 [Papaver somniferum]|uniref:uncharacterized protein LOC113340529 n=1 Tax=Papaver somniferum TaxID=3469 RepID=UPI000E6FC8AE|nr:uncharacterized protein LOC113340529 [Papaver somniferum]